MILKRGTHYIVDEKIVIYRFNGFDSIIIRNQRFGGLPILRNETPISWSDLLTALAYYSAFEGHEIYGISVNGTKCSLKQFLEESEIGIGN